MKSTIGRVYAPVLRNFARPRPVTFVSHIPESQSTTRATGGDQEESSKLRKVNRTIHELVQDRVSARVMACRKGWEELLVSHGNQGSDDSEINIDLTTFHAHYASQTRDVVLVPVLLPIPPQLNVQQSCSQS